MSISHFEIIESLEARKIVQRAIFVSRVNELMNQDTSEEAVVTDEFLGPVIFLPVKNLEDRSIGLRLQRETDYSEFRLTISIDDIVERNFHKYRFMEPLIVTDEKNSKIAESHLLYLSAAEIIRHYMVSQS